MGSSPSDVLPQGQRSSLSEAAGYSPVASADYYTYPRSVFNALQSGETSQGRKRSAPVWSSSVSSSSQCNPSGH
eukprot:9483914-Pyramimonas_sp.AAC.1